MNMLVDKDMVDRPSGWVFEGIPNRFDINFASKQACHANLSGDSEVVSQGENDSMMLNIVCSLHFSKLGMAYIIYFASTMQHLMNKLLPRVRILQ